jgi:isopentenyldiphosphate isomerase
VQDEIFDVVDASDQVVGRRSRGEVHRLGLMHRATHVLVFNSRGEVFLQQRSLAKDRQPGLWDSSASGHLDAGESYDACAARELREELGIATVAALERLFKVPASPQTDQEHVWIYRVKAEGPFQLNPEEIRGGAWFSPDAVTEWMAARPGDFAGTLLLIWPRITSSRGS